MNENVKNVFLDVCRYVLANKTMLNLRRYEIECIAAEVFAFLVAYAHEEGENYAETVAGYQSHIVSQIAHHIAIFERTGKPEFNVSNMNAKNQEIYT